MWLIYLRINLQQIKFDNQFRVQNGRSKIRVSSLDVGNELANIRLKFRCFKIRNTYFGCIKR